jgi:peptide/nickel transport system permease protein
LSTAVDSPEPAAAVAVRPPVRHRFGAQHLRHLLGSNLSLIVGSFLVGVFVICAVLAPVIAPFDPNLQHPDGLTALGAPISPGDDKFLLGTDELGRDMLSRLIYGARVALLIAVVPNLLSLILATVVGVAAGYIGGWFDTILMRFTEMVMTLPAVLLALALTAVVGRGIEMIFVALVIVAWTYPARVVYGEVLRIKEHVFVEAARALGASSLRIMVRHLLPHLRHLLIIYFTLNAAFMVILEAGLGFLGFGVQPPAPSWGAMLGSSREYFFWPWLIVLPGLCLLFLILGFYLLGEGLQQRFGAGRVTRMRL